MPAHSTSPAAAWEAIAARLSPATADAVEENATDLGLAPDSDDFWSACVAEGSLHLCMSDCDLHGRRCSCDDGQDW